MPETRSAVLFLIFNRPDTTTQVFEQIRAARPPRLYVAADGPRPTKPAEADVCNQTREVVKSVDWPCTVKTLFRDKNLGCKEAIASALDWFFSQEEEGIILEDDCVPAPSFFDFCDTLLARYRNDLRIRHICGCNFQKGVCRSDGSYYFSNLTHVWGWASWRRAWRHYDKNLTSYSEDEIFARINTCFNDPLIAAWWLQMAMSIKKQRVDTWDIQLAITNLMNAGHSIIPNANLISNIGFDSRATHTIKPDENRNALPVCALDEITAPTIIKTNIEADLFTLASEFTPSTASRRKYNRLKYRLKRFASHIGGPQSWKRAGT